MNRIYNKNTIIATVVVIALLIAIIGCLAFALDNSFDNNAIANADTEYTNGVVSEDYVTDYRNQSGAVAISSGTDLLNWLKTNYTTEYDSESKTYKPVIMYAYLTADVSFTGNTLGKSVQYHYLDGCGHKITITSASGSITGGNGGTEDPIVAEDSSFTNSTFAQTSDTTINQWLDAGDATYGDADGIISTYGGNATPFGKDNGDNNGFHTAGYLGAVFAYSSMTNTNVVFNGTFALKDLSTSRGLSIGIMFGYMYGSMIDNVSLTVNGRMGIYYSSQKNGELEGECTVCMGGYAGVVDNSSTISNSKITMSEGSFISGYSQGTGNNRNYPRVFAGGMCGSLLASEITNSTATGSGNIRAWAGGNAQDNGNNRLGCSGIIAGINVSTSNAKYAYTPKNTGNNVSGSSKATAGTIDGVICSWTGVALYLVGSSQYVGDFYHGTSIGGNTGRNISEHCYGGLICAAAEANTIKSVSYTFEKSTLFDIAFDTFRYLRSPKTTGGDGWNVSKNSSSIGVQPVVSCSNIPAANYFTLEMQQVNGSYATTTGTYTRAQYTGTGDSVTLNGKTYVYDNTFVSKGSISNIQTDVFGLNWSSTSSKANLVASVDVTKISGYAENSGLFVWNVEALLNGTSSAVNKTCYAYATSMEDALRNYRQYEFTDSIMSRNSSGATYKIRASVGYVGTYILNDDDLTTQQNEYSQLLGNKTYDKGVGLASTPSIKLYTIKNLYNAKQTYYKYEDSVYTEVDFNNLQKGNEYFVKTGTDTYTSAGVYEEKVPMDFLATYTGISEQTTYTSYTNSDIWKVFKQNDANPYGFNAIQDAGTYDIRVYNGESVVSNNKFKYDFLDENIKIVAYKVDNKYYREQYKTSQWQPKYTYTINQKELTGSWDSLANSVDGENYSTPTNFTYTGTAYNFKYLFNQAGLISGDTNTVPMSYELISYTKLGAAQLEIGTDYYVNIDGVYTLIGKYAIEDEDKYFIDPSDSSIHIAISNTTTYYKRIYTVTSNVKNAGDYRITINECSNANYKLPSKDSLVRTYFITVAPRTIKVLYRNMNNLVYSANQQIVTWAIANHNNQTLISSATGVTAANANIVAYYVFDDAALDFSFDANNGEFTIAGEYFVTISLASGAVAKNYLLPTTALNISSEDGETVVDIYDTSYDVAVINPDVSEYFLRTGGEGTSEDPYTYTANGVAAYDSTKTYYVRTGEGTEIKPYVYTEAKIETFEQGITYYLRSGDSEPYTYTINKDAYDSTKTYYTRTDTLNTNGVTRLDYDDDNDLQSISRIVTIQKAEVDLLRQYTISIDSAAYVDRANGKTYNTYDGIGTYTQKDIDFKGVNQSGYFEEEDYKGYNNIACVIKGVEEAVSGKTYKYFDLIYVDPKFYPATWNGAKYEVADNAVPTSTVSSQGTYVVVLSFDTDAYINYEEKEFYVVYKVNGVALSIDIDATALVSELDYDTQDHISAYSGFGTVEGLLEIDANKGAGLNYIVYKQNNNLTANYIEDADSNKYELVTNMINAGKYIVVVAHDSIPMAGYNLTYNTTGCEQLPAAYGELPYFAVTIKQIDIHISVGTAEKIYSQPFTYRTGNIDYEILSGETYNSIFASDADKITVGFTSLGFNSDAAVGKYSIVSAFTGEAAQNYNFIVDEENTFTVNKAPLQYTIANVSKTYGEAYDMSLITKYTLTKYTLNYGDVLTSMTFKSIGAIASTDVGVYPIVVDQVVGTGMTNYEITIIGTMTVMKKTLTLDTVTADSNLVYDASAKNVTVTFNGINKYKAVDITEFAPATTYYTYSYAVYTPVVYNATPVSTTEYFTFNADTNTYVSVGTGLASFEANTIYYTKQVVYNVVDTQEAFDNTVIYYVRTGEEGSYVYTQATIKEFGEGDYYTYTPAVYTEENVDYSTEFDINEEYYTRTGESAPYTYTKVTISAFAANTVYYTKTTTYVQTEDAEPVENKTYYTKTGDSEPYTYTEANVSEGFGSDTYYEVTAETYNVVTKAVGADTYYTEADGVYTEATGLIAFEMGVTYYTLTSAEDYVLVDKSQGFNNAIVYYVYDGVDYTPVTIVAFAEDTVYCTAEDVYAAVTTLDNFDTDVDYYTYNGSQYVLAENIEGFVVGVEYSTYSQASFKEVTGAYVEGTQYYIEDADVINAVVTYNGDSEVTPINVGNYSAIVTSIVGDSENDKSGNYEFFANTTSDCDFAITKRPITLEIDDFEMGYGDTKLEPKDPSIGYTLETGSLDFVESDITSGNLVLTFVADDMNGEPGSSQEKVVSLVLSGDAASNYEMNYKTDPASDSYGDLSVLSKELTKLNLVNDKITYTGKDLKDAVIVDTNNPDDLVKTKYEVKVNATDWEAVTEVKNVGTYRVTVELAEGSASGNYSGDKAIMEFEVTKATILIEDFKSSDIVIYHNKLVFVGEFEDGTVMVSKDNVFGDVADAKNYIDGLKPLTSYTFYVKVVGASNYNDSVVVTLRATTSYNPDLVNEAIEELGNKYGFKDIPKYNEIMLNYDKVSESEKDLVDTAGLNAAKARYEKLLSSGAKAVKVTKQVVGKALNKTYKVAAVGAVSGLSLAFAGLSIMLTKKKKKENMKKAHKVINKKNILIALVVVMSIISLTMVFVSCDKKIDTPTEPPVDPDALTETTFFTAASSVTNPKWAVSIKSKQEDYEIYYRKANGSEDSKFGIEVGENQFEEIANSLTFRTDAFSDSLINGNVYSGTVASPNEYLGITEEGVNVTVAHVIITLDNSKALKSIVVEYEMTVDDIEYKATITVTP